MRTRVVLKIFCLLFPIAVSSYASQNKKNGMAAIPSGSYIPFFLQKDPKVPASLKRDPIFLVAFRMDRSPVTNADYLKFVNATPAWRRSQVKRLFADLHYLEDWKNDLSFTQPARGPVTHISWFAANAYCHAQSKELPTTDQWEYAAADGGRGTAAAQERILAWYAKPNPKHLIPVGRSPRNGLGLYDLYGLVWEWTLDFNNAIAGDEPQDGGSAGQNLFCGNGSQGALDATDYASFMRYSFRSSLKANYAVGNLGFRCVKGASL